MTVRDKMTGIQKERALKGLRDASLDDDLLKLIEVDDEFYYSTLDLIQQMKGSTSEKVVLINLFLKICREKFSRRG